MGGGGVGMSFGFLSKRQLSSQRWSTQMPAKTTLNNMCVHESATKINWYFINLHDETRVQFNSKFSKL